MSKRFVLLGHVDHGKSTMAGRIIVDTKQVINDKVIDDREISKIKEEARERGRESWWLAYLLDIDDDERDKGKTHDYMNVPIKWNDIEMELIDVPGHKEYVPCMVTGCAFANIGVIVISARQGEYESGLNGQTIEHVLIARGIGISTLIVAINKMDSINWNMNIFEKIKNNFLKNIKKYQFRHIEFIPVSAYNGDNIVIVNPKTEVEKSLMMTIATVPFQEPVHQEIILENCNIVCVKCLFHHIPKLLVSDYECVVHTKDKLVNIKIIAVDNNNIGFITNKNNPDKPVDLLIQFVDSPPKVYSNLVIRDLNMTIGFARIVADDKATPRIQAIKQKLMKGEKISAMATCSFK